MEVFELLTNGYTPGFSLLGELTALNCLHANGKDIAVVNIRSACLWNAMHACDWK